MKVAYSISRKGSRRYDFLKPFDRELVVRSGLSLRHVSPYLFTTVIIILYYIMSSSFLQCNSSSSSVDIIIISIIIALYCIIIFSNNEACSNK